MKMVLDARRRTKRFSLPSSTNRLGSSRVVSRSQRRAMIDREEPKLSLVRQCALLGMSRSSLYYLPTEAGAEDLELMALIDQQYLKTPFYGSRRMTAWLSNHGHQVNRKRVRRLMQLIGLEAIYRRPNTSKPNPGHKVYPYLLRGLEINRVNQVWATDITYIPMARGFLYLVAIMDWHSRYVLAWRLSNTLEVELLCCGSGRGLEQGSATDLQHRPGQPVHQRGLHQHAAGARRSSEHGRQGPVHGQRRAPGQVFQAVSPQRCLLEHPQALPSDEGLRDTPAVDSLILASPLS